MAECKNRVTPGRKKYVTVWQIMTHLALWYSREHQICELACVTLQKYIK